MHILIVIFIGIILIIWGFFKFLDFVSRYIFKTKERLFEKERFLKFNKKKIILLIIISTFVPTYIYLMLCGGFKPVLLYIFEEFFIKGDGFSVSNTIAFLFALIFWIPYFFINYIYACFIYKILTYFRKDREVYWASILVVLIISVIIFLLTMSSQDISC